MSQWSAEMPSNIALIKYMGKSDTSKNVATNPSISLTLPKLLTRVELITSSEDAWAPLNCQGFQAPELSEFGQTRFLNHLQFLKQQFQIQGQCFLVKSANNFASDCGLASSASSFAALTMVTYEAAKELVGLDLSLREVAHLSRQGSGSSCRSFFQPWCEWSGDSIASEDLGFANLQHQVVVVEDSKKLVSSSQAHKRVLSSLLFEGRVARATQRCTDLKLALKSKDWQKSYEICWNEFWDMHALFETSSPSFGYMTDKSLKVLNQVRAHWQQYADGPIATMDAGANIHLLYREDQKKLEFNV